jgi:hypothetical protein
MQALVQAGEVTSRELRFISGKTRKTHSNTGWQLLEKPKQLMTMLSPTTSFYWPRFSEKWLWKMSANYFTTRTKLTSWWMIPIKPSSKSTGSSPIKKQTMVNVVNLIDNDQDSSAPEQDVAAFRPQQQRSQQRNQQQGSNYRGNQSKGQFSNKGSFQKSRPAAQHQLQKW